VLVALLAMACGSSTLDGAHLHAHPDAIDLGFADCGGATPSADWVVENDGTLPLEITATPDPRLALDQTHFFVDAHASTTVHVAGLGGPNDGLAGEIRHAAIHVTTNDGSPPFDIDVTATTHGATLAFVPPQIDLGLVPVSITSPPHGFALTNTGNADVDVSLSQPNPDFTIAIDTLHVGADQTVQGTATFFASAPGATKTTVAIDAKGVLCGDVPKLEVVASGSDGVFGNTPGVIDFGSVYCGHAAKPKTLTLSNTGSAPYSFEAKLASGASFQVSPSSGVVKASLALTLSPLAIPQYSSTASDLYGDTLIITTNIPNDTPHIVPIHESARGAIFHFLAATDSFGKVQVGSDVTRYESLVNDGTSATNSFSQMTDGNFSVQASQYQGTSGAIPITFHPAGTLLGLEESATFTLGVAGPMCAPAPSITVTATTHDLAFSVLALDDATCADARPNFPWRVYCWGNNAAGQLGTTSVTSATTPRMVTLPTQQQGLGLIGGGTYVIAGPSGPFISWGTVNGILSAPTASTYFANFGGASTTVFCFADAFLHCGGKGGYLGDGTTNDSASPVPISLQATGKIATGFDGHTCGATTEGVACWGPNDWGQIGNGATSTQNALSPQIVASTDQYYTNVAAGDGFSCAQSYISQPTDVLCWGRNTSSECGAVASSSPVLVPNTVTVGSTAYLAAGRDFVCAQPTSASTISCWGSNARGQLGDGAQESISSAPVTVGLAGKPGYIVGAGGYHACSVIAGGQVQCWGGNASGELGDGTTNDATSPVFVKGFD
jgi:hypothetical protein